jgi:arylsulfatase A-like enzyme
MSSRASWISGTQVPVHNVWGNGISTRRETSNFIAPLKDAGYFTAMIGKTHYDPVPNFDYTDIRSGNLVKRQPNTPSGHFLETYLVNQVKNLLQNEIQGVHVGKNQPWFVHLSFVSPHPPSNVPLEWQGYYKHANISRVNYAGPQEWAHYPRQLKGFMSSPAELSKAFPNGKPDHNYIHDFRQKYYELANYVDYQVGRMLDFLDKAAMAKNTLVIFTSDHGTNLWDHGMESKFNFFEPSWQVPLIMRGPGLPSGHTHRYAAGVDIPATIVAAAQAKRPAGLNGFDLISPLKQRIRSPRTMGVAAALLQGLALTTDKWKLTFYLDDANGQLFDRDSDPHELRNLFHDPGHSQVKSLLLAALLRWRAGLEPVHFLQNHDTGGDFGNTKFVHRYTMKLTGMEAEIGLQEDLAHPLLRGASLDDDDELQFV